MSDNDHPSFPVWVPPGEHDRPKPGTPEHEEWQKKQKEESSATASAAAAGGGLAGMIDGGGAATGSPAVASPWTRQGGGPQIASNVGFTTKPARSSNPSGSGAEMEAGPSQGSSPTTGTSGSTVPPERKKPLRSTVMVSAVVVLIGGGLYGSYRGLVYLLEWSATKIPVSWEESLGKSVAEDILKKHKVCADPRLNAFVQQLGNRLKSGMVDNPYKFRFKVLDAKEVNAFALPGGYVFILKGLIEKAKSADELSGVLAHEVQHVLCKHGMKRLMRSAGFMLAIRILFGDVGGFVDLLGQSAIRLTSLKHDRGDELEADMEGLKLMYRAGLDPNGMPMFFKRMMELESEMGSTAKALLTFVSTHPPSEERMKRLKSYIRKHGMPENLKPVTGFEQVKNLCGAISFTQADKDPPAHRDENPKAAPAASPTPAASPAPTPASPPDAARPPARSGKGAAEKQ